MQGAAGRGRGVNGEAQTAYAAGQAAQFDADCRELCAWCHHRDYEPAVWDAGDGGYWHAPKRNRKGAVWCDATVLRQAWAEREEREVTP